jgi:prepilin-type N-terminal cleavage/methylation domain-containing protein
MTKIFTTISNRVMFMRKRPSKGFTTVELLAVVVVIGLLASVGGVYFASYKQVAVDKCARDIVLAAKYARVLAIEKQSICRLVLDKVENSLCLVVSGGKNRVVRDEYFRPRKFGGDIEFEGVVIATENGSAGGGDDSAAIVFRSDGTADSAVVQIGDGENHCTVYISAATGKARAEAGKAKETTADVVDLDLYE